METTALAPLNLPATGALARAQQGQFLPQDIWEEAIAPADDDDFEDIQPRHKVLVGNGQEGKFLDRDDGKEATGPSEIMGVALASVDTQVMFQPNNQSKDRFTYYGLNVLQEAPRWICRCTDVKRSKPELNPALTPEQREEATQLRIGGAVGTSCRECPMSGKKGWLEVNGQNVRPPCTEGSALVWLDSQKEEPAILRLLSESARNLRNFISRHFKIGRKSLMPYHHVLRLTFKKRQGANGSYYSIDAGLAETTPKELHPVFNRLRQAHYYMVAEALNEEMEHLESLAEQEAAAEAAAGGGRVVDQQAGVTIGPDGLPVYPDEPRGFSQDDIGMDDVPF